MGNSSPIPHVQSSRMSEVRSHLEEALQHPHGDQRPHAQIGRDRREQRQHRGGQHPEAKEPLAAVPGGEQASGQLEEEVADEEGGEDPACGNRCRATACACVCNVTETCVFVYGSESGRESVI